jgi:CBS domain containing-hemolysin-like protein
LDVFDFWSTFWNLMLVLLLVLLNGFFVAAEFALVKVRQSRLQELVNDGNKKAKYALAVTKKLDAYLSATQFGITLASLGLGWVGEKTISHMVIGPILRAIGFNVTGVSETISIIIAFAIITFMHIVLGELAPKSLAIQKSDATALWLSMPLLIFYKIFYPLIMLLNGAANALLGVFGVHPASENEAAHTEEEIRILMNQSVKSGHINKEEMALFDNIFEFSDRLAREVMLPRIDMDCLFLNATYAENLSAVYKTKHTRYPVALEDKDEIVGFVHITDLLTADPDEEHDLKSFLRPILNVPESMEISQVLKLMQKKRSQLAIVIDEYGGTAGLLTAEEILEEIVGEIQDEFDDELPMIEIKENLISVDGRVLIEELSETLHLDIEDDEVDSIGGWLFKNLEGTPAVGSKVIVNGRTFEVAEVDRLRIVRIHIYKTELVIATPEDTNKE